MTIELADNAIAGLSEAEVLLELACALYARGKLSAVGAAKLAGVDFFSFQGALKERKIPQNYGVDDLSDDVAALKRLFPQ